MTVPYHSLSRKNVIVKYIKNKINAYFCYKFNKTMIVRNLCEM